MRKATLILAMLAVFGLTIGGAYLGADSQANAATVHATLVGHHGYYGRPYGFSYGYSVRPYVGYYHGWGSNGCGSPYYGSGFYGYGVYAYPYRSYYYSAPYVAYPYYGYWHGYSGY